MKRFLALGTERERERAGPDVLFRAGAVTTQAVWGQKEAHRLLRRSDHPFSSQRKNGIYLKYSKAYKDSPPPFSFFPLPPTGSLAASPSCWKRKGGRGEGGEDPSAQTTLWESLSSAFTSLWGSGCYWFSFMCDTVPLT